MAVSNQVVNFLQALMVMLDDLVCPRRGVRIRRPVPGKHQVDIEAGDLLQAIMIHGERIIGGEPRGYSGVCLSRRWSPMIMSF